MSVALRFWEGHLYKDATEIGFATGTISVDAGLVTFNELGNYDLAARRHAIREMTGTIEHGYISPTLFASMALGSGPAGTLDFDFKISDAATAIVISGCMLETWDIEVPADGWITETIAWRGKTTKSL